MNWEDAAKEAITSIIIRADFASGSSINELRDLIDGIIDSAETRATGWQQLGASAYEIAVDWGLLSRDPKNATDFLTNLVTRKQRDYGHENISRFGMVGLYVRMHDKIARLENLLGNGKAPQNESVGDNLIDVIGYSTIAVMLAEGQFMLPLRPTVVERV